MGANPRIRGELAEKASLGACQRYVVKMVAQKAVETKVSTLKGVSQKHKYSRAREMGMWQDREPLKLVFLVASYANLKWVP